MKLRLHQFDLPLKHVFTISRESHSIQPTLVVELSDGQYSGFGEATTNSYYGVTIESMSASIEIARQTIEEFELGDPTELWKLLQTSLANDPFSLCAIDQAAHDLWGKRLGKSVVELWGLNTENVPQSNFTIGIDDIETMVAKLQEVAGWPIYKIKLGTKHDLDIVKHLRKHTDATFRVDANCGWTAETTIANSKPLRDLGVEFIEQPLPADQSHEQERVFRESALPIIADESCLVPDDVQHCEGRFHGINIKLVKCGGLTPARMMIDDARQRGLKVMVGCMTESTVGISAIAQLLPLLDYVDMDGAALLAKDIATGATVEFGVCRYPTENGTGVRLLENRL